VDLGSQGGEGRGNTRSGPGKTQAVKNREEVMGLIADFKNRVMGSEGEMGSLIQEYPPLARTE